MSMMCVTSYSISMLCIMTYPMLMTCVTCYPVSMMGITNYPSSMTRTTTRTTSNPTCCCRLIDMLLNGEGMVPHECDVHCKLPNEYGAHHK